MSYEHLVQLILLGRTYAMMAKSGNARYLAKANAIFKQVNNIGWYEEATGTVYYVRPMGVAA